MKHTHLDRPKAIEGAVTCQVCPASCVECGARRTGAHASEPMPAMVQVGDVRMCAHCAEEYAALILKVVHADKVAENGGALRVSYLFHHSINDGCFGFFERVKDSAFAPWKVVI